MSIGREDVEFTSRGATLRGWLFRPGGGLPGPGVVMAHGFTAVREMFLDRYGEVFAAAGFTVLAYDHLGFGASDGEPRQSPTPSIQLEGYRDAIGWLAREPSVDPARIGLWGSSFSGGEVIILASEDLGIRCAVAQVPAFDATALELSAATLAAVGGAIEGGRLDDTVAATSPTADGIGVMFADGADAWFARVAAERAPSWRNEVRIGALTELFRPIDHLADAKVPLLLIVAPADALTPPAAGIAAAAAIDNVEVAEIEGGHFDAYEAGFAASSEAAVDWFGRYLTA